MRIAKKFLAVLLAVLSIMSVCAFSASAVEAPEFKLELITENDTTAIVRFSFEKGAISAFDATFKTSSAIKECGAITNSESFKDFKNDYEKETGGSIMTANNPSTKKVTFIATAPVTKATAVFDVAFVKKTSAPITEADISVTIDSCAVTTKNSYGVTENIDITDLAKVNVLFGSFTFRTKDYTLNYKDRMTLDFETNYATEDLVWETSNAKVAQADEVGVVTATGKGNATITVKNANGDVLDTCNVNVKYSVGQWLIIIFLFGWIWY